MRAILNPASEAAAPRERGKPRSICLIGLDAYPVLSGRSQDQYIGGESVQLSLLARAFRELGLETSLLALDYGQGPETVVDGVRVLRTYGPREGAPGLRFLHPRLSRLWLAMRRANADVYYQSCAGAHTGQVAAFCRLHGKRFIFRAAHDHDCDPSKLIIRFWRDKILYAYGLRRADVVATQSETQRKMMLEQFGRPSAVVSMAVEPPRQDAGLPQAERDIDALWVNNLRDFKRPELCLEIARRLPRRRFTMIGGPVPGWEALYDRIKAEAAELPNLRLLGFVPYRAVNAYFARAKVFLNTSSSEGFPNSFLQAWARGTPVASFFDPDGLIKRQGLGVTPVALEEMVRTLDDLLDDHARLAALSRAAVRHVSDRYSPVNVAKTYLDLVG